MKKILLILFVLAFSTLCFAGRNSSFNMDATMTLSGSGEVTYEAFNVTDNGGEAFRVTDGGGEDFNVR